MSQDVIKEWEVGASSGRRFEVLDGIRGVAILMVIIIHSFPVRPNSGLWAHIAGAFISTGWMGVPIFFVLSGFLISYPFFIARARSPHAWSLPGYARRRIGKIVPPFYFSIILFSTYYCLRYSDPGYWWIGLKWALAFPNFDPLRPHFNPPYWSLIVEIDFYIVLPVLFFLIRGTGPLRTALSMSAILFIVPPIVRQLTWPAGGTSPAAPLDFLMSRFPCQLDLFAWGILFAGILTSLPRTSLPRHLPYAGVALLVFTICLNAFLSAWLGLVKHPMRWSFELFHFLPGLCAFLLLFFVVAPESIGGRILSHPWLRFIGIVSYEWFLLHLPVIWLFRDIFANTEGMATYLLMTIPPIVLTFGLSVALYRYFSLPLLVWFRGTKSSPAMLPDPNSVSVPVN